MKRLSVVMAVVLGLALVFSVAGLAQGGQPEYKATGGVKFFPYAYSEWATFSFTAKNIGGTMGRGQAIWIDHKPFNPEFEDNIFYKIDIDYAEYVGPGEMIFGGVVVETNNPYVAPGETQHFWVIDGGSPGSGNDLVKQSWNSPTGPWGNFTVSGGNLVVHE